MKYTVVWKPAAEQDLAALWLTAANRSAVTYASYKMEMILKTDPLDWSESRPGGRRIMLVPPLGVEFQIKELDCLVEVLHVWLFRKKRHNP